MKAAMPSVRRVLLKTIASGLVLMVAGVLCVAGTARAQEPATNMVAMYIHQHWPYKHPYAARTWTLEDYRGYCGGLKALGYNTVMIWPVLETMPSPPTDSDRANLEKIAKVVDLLHRELGMRAYFALCPNIVARDEDARKATFERRHFFWCDARVNPRDPEALRRMMQARQEQLRPLAAIDGVSVIDCDPGGYPGSDNADFVKLFMAHRKMLDELRPGIELLYWVWAGWPAYSRFYQTGEFAWGAEAEFLDVLGQLKERSPDPWGLLNGVEYARKTGLESRVLALHYGAIEGEPAMPLTRFDWQGAYAAGKDRGPRGVMGNAQTHCAQLPNTFAFARGAAGKPLARPDFVQFAEDLIPGQGGLIVQSWETLQGADAAGMRQLAGRLEDLSPEQLRPGPLKGLLLNDPKRFVMDLVFMLRLQAAFRGFVAASESGQGLKDALKGFTAALSAWYDRTGYQNEWGWPDLSKALARLNSPRINQAMAMEGTGSTPFEKIADSYRRKEVFTPGLIQALNEECK
jgi:hypothetical protein